MYKLLFIGLVLISLTACKNEKTTFSGYVDTDLVYLSADYGGRLTDLAITKGQLVAGNQFLFRLDQTNDLYQVQISQFNQQDLLAQRQQILVQLQYNETQYRRTVAMNKHHAASQSDVDAAQRDRDVSKQQLAALDITIKSSLVDIADKKWQLTRKEHYATDRGIVFDTYYAQGEYVPAGAPVLSLITKNTLKAIFFVPEEQLSLIRLNAQVTITTDTNNRFATGRIAYIAHKAEYTPPIIYSREERQRLVFRVEVHIENPDLEHMHLGQPVTLELAS